MGYLPNIIFKLSRDTSIYSDWFKREGSEVYTYKNLDELIELLEEIKIDAEIDFEVLSSTITKREEYSRFLRMVSNTNLDDTKQNLLIKRKK